MQALSDPRFRRAPALLAALAVCGAASAASVQYDFTKASTSTGWNDARSLSKFDPTLGTLQSVEFFLGGTMVSQAELNNLSSSSGDTISSSTKGMYSITGTVGATTTTYYSSSLSYASTAGLDANTDQSPSDPNSNYYKYIAPHGVVKPATNLVIGGPSMTFSDGATLARFLGPGSISLAFMATASSMITAGGNALVSNITTADGTGYVRYNYIPTATPEPVSCAALAVGVVTLMRRRKAGQR